MNISLSRWVACVGVDPLLKLVRGLPRIAPCLEHICAGGGGDVAIEVYIYMYWCLTRMGLYLSVNVILLV